MASFKKTHYLLLNSRFLPDLAGVDLDSATMSEVYQKFGLEPGTQDFIGHAMALHLDER